MNQPDHTDPALKISLYIKLPSWTPGSALNPPKLKSHLPSISVRYFPDSKVWCFPDPQF